MFEIIDKKLGLGSCNISDLTVQQAHDFLEELGERVSIETLIFFYDEEKNMVVLNRDNVDYGFYIQAFSRFIKLDAGSREYILEKAPDSTKETFKVLNKAVERMEYQKDLDRLKHMNIPCRYMRAIDYIRRKEKSEWAYVFAFLYGRMCGKREERARRKAGARV